MVPRIRGVPHTTAGPHTYTCRIQLHHIRGCFTEAKRFEMLANDSIVDAPLKSRSQGWINTDIEITLDPPSEPASGLWTVTGSGKDRASCCRVNGIYSPSTGR